LLGLPHPPSAIFSSGGVMSVGFLQEIRKRNLKIPEDVSFIGFDDEIWCSFIDPPLTVVAQPVRMIGQEAAQLVIQLIQGWMKGEVRRIVLQPELIIRESCRQYKG
jgi:DNA-binding LacI/PurR family transcriptional regulator